ncbi:MAG: hypothetical protein ACFFCS_15430 [Candidatus Hodarchaeota archaeon]
MEYRINEFLTLKLVGTQTKIFVRDEPFINCKRLVLEIHLGDVPEYDEIGSIDEAKAMHATISHQRGMEPRVWGVYISPEEEFWGHCSNLQAWVEHDYDTRLLHSNLSFPLLKKLADAGDPLAEDVFSEEIIRRVKSCYEPTVQYLVSMGYVDYLTEDEKEALVEGEFLSRADILPRGTRRFRAGVRQWERQGPAPRMDWMRGMVKLKVALVGGKERAKEKFARLTTEQKFSKDYKATIGTTIFIKKVALKDFEVVLTVWDIAGQERWTSLRPLFYRGSRAALVCFEIDDNATFKRVEAFVREVRTYSWEDTPVLVVGLQSGKVSPAREKELEAFFKEKGLEYMKVDLRTGEFLERSYERLVRMIHGGEEELAE